MKVRVELLPNHYIVEHEITPTCIFFPTFSSLDFPTTYLLFFFFSDTSSQLKEDIVNTHFTLYKQVDPTCAETGLIIFYKKDVHFGALHSEVCAIIFSFGIYLALI